MHLSFTLHWAFCELLLYKGNHKHSIIHGGAAPAKAGLRSPGLPCGTDRENTVEEGTPSRSAASSTSAGSLQGRRPTWSPVS